MSKKGYLELCLLCLKNPCDCFPKKNKPRKVEVVHLPPSETIEIDGAEAQLHEAIRIFDQVLGISQQDKEKWRMILNDKPSYQERLAAWRYRVLEEQQKFNRSAH